MAAHACFQSFNLVCNASSVELDPGGVICRVPKRNIVTYLLFASCVHTVTGRDRTDLFKNFQKKGTMMEMPDGRLEAEGEVLLRPPVGYTTAFWNSSMKAVLRMRVCLADEATPNSAGPTESNRKGAGTKNWNRPERSRPQTPASGYAVFAWTPPSPKKHRERRHRRKRRAPAAKLYRMKEPVPWNQGGPAGNSPFTQWQ